MISLFHLALWMGLQPMWRNELEQQGNDLVLWIFYFRDTEWFYLDNNILELELERGPFSPLLEPPSWFQGLSPPWADVGTPCWVLLPLCVTSPAVDNIWEAGAGEHAS